MSIELQERVRKLEARVEALEKALVELGKSSFFEGTEIAKVSKTLTLPKKTNASSN